MSLPFFCRINVFRNPLGWLLFVLPAAICYGQPTQAAGQSSEYVAQIMFQVDQVVDAAAMQSLSPNDLRRIEQQTGAQFVAREGVVRFSPKPAAGYWLKVGIRRYQIDKDGYVHIPTRPSATRNLALFVQVGDVDPFGVLPRVQFVKAGQTPPPTIVKLRQKLPLEMNHGSESTGPTARDFVTDLLNARLETLQYPDSAQSSIAQSCMRPVLFQGPGDFPPGLSGAKCKRDPCSPGNTKACCLDYDGLGDGKPVNRNGGPVCAAVGYVKFISSTCYKWTFENLACINESALFWNNRNPKKKAPNCYQNHKYRNCQNLNMRDLNLAASKTDIKFGESVSLKLRNNTPGNFTCLTVATPARAGSPSVTNAGGGGFIKSKDCGGYRAAHFSDAAKRPRHYEDMTLRFTAPATPPQGSCKVTYKLTATNGGPGLAPPFNTWITARKADCSSEWTGWVKVVHTETGDGDQPFKFHDKYQEEQKWTIIQRVADSDDTYDATWEVRADGEENSRVGCNATSYKVNDGGTKKAVLSIYEDPGKTLQVRLSPPPQDEEAVKSSLKRLYTSSANANCTETTELETFTIFAADWGNDITVNQPGDSVSGSKTLDPGDPAFGSGWVMESQFTTVAKKATLSWSLTRVH